MEIGVILGVLLILLWMGRNAWRVIGDKEEFQKALERSPWEGGPE